MNWLKTLRKILTLQCVEASELSSQEVDQPLRVADRLALRCHLLICRSCKIFRQQVQVIHACMALPEDQVDRKLSESARERIAERLRQESQPPGGS